MPRLAALFFVFLYMVSMLRPVQPYVEYFLNQDYIAEFLCINKDKPELQCQGKCHLMKELEKQEENNPLKSLRVSLENYPIGFVNILKINSPEPFDSSNKSANSFYKTGYRFNYIYSAFQPPDLV